jgi:uncharacterized SAM-binding protein YcdF (DUF218 family)
MRRFLLTLFIVIFTWIIGPEIPIVFTSITVQPQPADVLIVPGARLWGDQPSGMLKLRLDKASELYRADYAKQIIVSGARGPDEIASEAAVMRNYLVERGLPAEAVFLEDQSYNTIENLTYSQKIMHTKGWQSAVIVTNPFHIYRCLLIAGQIGMQATAASASPHLGISPAPIISNIKQYLRESLAVTKHYVISLNVH